MWHVCMYVCTRAIIFLFDRQLYVPAIKVKRPAVDAFLRFQKGQQRAGVDFIFVVVFFRFKSLSFVINLI